MELGWQKRLDDIEATIDALAEVPYRDVPDLATLDVSGTIFLISPASYNLSADIEPPTLNEASLFDRTLHGFTDVWLANPTTPEFSVDLMDHRGGGDSESRLDPAEFFTATEFDEADHHIRGEFDAKGNFSGTIRIFDQNDSAIDIPCPAPSPSRCGPFTFEVGVVQGKLSESKLDTEGFRAIETKLKKLGGLYIYKDGIRVQPYGRPDVDYLELEERRTRGIAYYFFHTDEFSGQSTFQVKITQGCEKKRVGRASRMVAPTRTSVAFSSTY